LLLIIDLFQDVLSSAFEDIPKTINLSDSISTKCKESNSFFEKFSLGGLRQPKDESPVAKKARFTVYESPKLKLDSFFVRLPKNQAPATEEIPKNASDPSVDIEHITPKNLAHENSVCDPSAAGTSAMSSQEILMDGKLLNWLSVPSLILNFLEPEESETCSQSPTILQTEESISEAGKEVTDEDKDAHMTESSGDISAGNLSKDKIQDAGVSKGETSKAVSVIVVAGSSRAKESQDVRFTAGLDPSKGDLAEEELKKVFQKHDFLKVLL
jgi:hypothetical protein